DYATKPVQDSAQQARADRNVRILCSSKDGSTGLKAVNRLERHRKNPSVPEAGHLSSDDPARGGVDLTETADRAGWPLRLDNETGDIGDGSAPAQQIEPLQILYIGIQVKLRELAH